MFEFSPRQLDGLAVLGTGVWGVVYDLGDSTVLKVAKRIGGLGDGNQKVRHEIAVMESLARTGANSSFQIPRFLATGPVPSDTPLCDEGFTIWARMTKIEGQILESQDIKILSGAKRTALAATLAAALDEFHTVLAAADMAPTLQPYDALSLSGLEELDLQDRDRERLTKVEALLSTLPAGDLRPVHGDFNLSNIVFDADYKIAGILDFAETCRTLIEQDICSLTSELPFLKDDLIGAYEVRTGRIVDRTSLDLVELRNYMVGLLICRYRMDRPDEAMENQLIVDRRIAAHGTTP